MLQEHLGTFLMPPPLLRCAYWITGFIFYLQPAQTSCSRLVIALLVLTLWAHVSSSLLQLYLRQSERWMRIIESCFRRKWWSSRWLCCWWRCWSAKRVSQRHVDWGMCSIITIRRGARRVERFVFCFFIFIDLKVRSLYAHGHNTSSWASKPLAH